MSKDEDSSRLLPYVPVGAILITGEYHSDIHKFYLGEIQSRDAFRPIARERIYLRNYSQLFRVMIREYFLGEWKCL